MPATAVAVPTRTGTSLLERAALTRAREDIAAMPASLVVQLLLWPETIAEWARAQGMQSAIVYNALHRVKPYRRVRERLAERLDVPRGALDTLIDSPTPLPSALRSPAPPDATRPASGGRRNGSNLLERKALLRLELDLAAMPASLVVQLALWPDTIAAWARREWPRGGGTAAAMTYALLANSQRQERIERALARRLGVEPATLRSLIVAECPEPSTRRIPLRRVPSELAIPARRPRRPPPEGQLTLGI